jgi:hypothetical protein
MSWTDDLNIACHFARKWCNCRNPEVWDWAHDPAVYRVTIPMKDIRCYTDDRGEREYIIDATKLPKLARIEFRDGEMEIRRRVWRYGLDFKMYRAVIDPERELVQMGYVPALAERGTCDIASI